MNLLALPRYDVLGASSRLRFFQYFESLSEAGISVSAHPLFDNLSLARRYERGKYNLPELLNAFRNRLSILRSLPNDKLLWVEKELLPWLPLRVELSILNGAPFVLDYDDAIFHNYDQNRLAVIRKLLGHRIDGLMARATLVICGNDYLAQRAKDAGAAWVEVLPTVIDLARYPYPQKEFNFCRSQKLKIVWIGSPSTLRYLQLLIEPLQELARHIPFIFRVIGGEFSVPGVEVESIPWSESSEVAHIAECDVGVMPLYDSPWERGKCGYKLIQYMACGLPIIASPVGVNSRIVHDGVNGFLADTSEAWVAHLNQLLSDTSLRLRMGAAGRLMVEREYSLQVMAPRLAALLQRAAIKGI
jgi:glycosyltransferase involved in cell wall biosynthesis